MGSVFYARFGISILILETRTALNQWALGFCIVLYTVVLILVFQANFLSEKTSQKTQENQVCQIAVATWIRTARLALAGAQALFPKAVPPPRSLSLGVRRPEMNQCQWSKIIEARSVKILFRDASYFTPSTRRSRRTPPAPCRPLPPTDARSVRCGRSGRQCLRTATKTARRWSQCPQATPCHVPSSSAPAREEKGH